MLYIGLMSGTSMDSIDAALVNFATASPQLIGTHAVPLPQTLKQQLLDASQLFHQPTLGELDNVLGERFATAACELLGKLHVNARDIKGIGSHGQTVFHQPPQPGQQGFSVQLGNPNIIAQRTGVTTIADFRRMDMAVGGQGAPLVPAFHAAMFRHPAIHRAIINIGGIANITLLPVHGDVTGFDTGPGNVLMDAWIEQHQQCTFDDRGKWAQQGLCHQALLQHLLAEQFFNLAPPKSTGRELFNLSWLNSHLAGFPPVPPVDVQATLTELTAVTIANALQKHAPATQALYVCGGGARNDLLMEKLSQRTRLRIATTTELGIDPAWVEAAAFAWLAKQRLENQPGNLPAVTGASRAVVLGGVWSAG